MATPLPKHIIDEIRKRSIFDSIIRNHIENSIKNEHPMFQSFVKNHSIFFGEYQGETENKPMPTFYHFSRPFIKKKMKGGPHMSNIEVGDEIEFCVNGKCLNYKVARSEEAVFLSNHTKPSQLEYENISPTNASIFEELGFDINEYEHYRWCRKIYGYSPVNKDTDKIDFPEAKNLEDLQRVIQHLVVLCEKSKIKESGVKNEKVKIEDLHIGQTVYKHGKTPGKIIALNGIHSIVSVRKRTEALLNPTLEWDVNDITLSPQFDFSDWETVHKLHQELWEWLEAHPDKDKEDWPRWKENGGDVPDCLNCCFYCEYTKHIPSYGVIDCTVCPGDWKTKSEAKSEANIPACCRGAFGIWYESDSRNVRKMAARIIKNS